jgi:diguanylate cyclase (GGDEF)-like protein
MQVIRAAARAVGAPAAVLPLAALVARGRGRRLRHRLETLEQERCRLRVAVRRIGDAFASNLDLDALVDIVAHAAGEALGAQAVRAGVVAGDTVVPRLTEGVGVSWVALLEDADAAALTTGRVATVAGDGRWAAAAPIGPPGAPVAVVALGRERAPFATEELDLLAHLCGQAAVAAGNAARHERLHQQALTDELTGLANHRRLQELLAEATAEHARSGLGVALVLLDLDDFKQVNDRFGHQTGDQVLRAVGRCLRAHCRGSDEPARYGGEELAVVLVDADATRAATLAERLRQAVETLRIQGPDGERIALSVSIGVAVAGPHATTAAGLIGAADRALYDAKLGGKNAVRLARRAPGAGRDDRRRGDLEHDMRQALGRDELVLHYQPKLELATGAVVGVEALVRWRHPQHGMLGPSRFLPTLEGTELMGAFTSWVLERALRQAGAWRRAGRPMPVAVNVTAQDVDDAGLPDRIAALLALTGAQARDLRLEISEHTAMSDADGAAATLATLRQLGIGLSLDDFGSGYSSLTRLRVLPVDELKLDRSFLVDAGEVDLAVVRAAISIARDLGLAIVAEGVEDARRLEVLRGLGCDRAQGFHVAPPLLPAELAQWLDARPDAAAAVPGPAAVRARGAR